MKADDIIDMWDMNGNISANFGTVIHDSLDYYFKYNRTPNCLISSKIVVEFIEKYMTLINLDKCKSEIFITDVKHGLCGYIDLLYDVGDGYIISDYKISSNDSNEKKYEITGVFKNLKPVKMTRHILQLNFYRKILENTGHSVKAMMLYEYTDDWRSYEIENIEYDIVKL